MVILGVPANAVADQDEQCGVYVSPEKQEELSKKLYENEPFIRHNQLDDEYILKESITQVYFFEPMDYLATGKLEFNLEPKSYLGIPPDGSTYYVAKTVTKDGMVNEDISFKIDANGEAKSRAITWEGSFSRVSFADHKDRIEKMLLPLGIEKVDASCVKYVEIGGIYFEGHQDETEIDYGTVFYYKKDDFSIFIDVDAYSVLFGDKGYLLESELREGLERLKEKREFEIEFVKKYNLVRNPFWGAYDKHRSSGQYGITYDGSSVINVKLISEYLENGKYFSSNPNGDKQIGTKEVDFRFDWETEKSTETTQRESTGTTVDNGGVKNDKKTYESLNVVSLTLCVAFSIICIILTMVILKLKKLYNGIA